jgi:quinolinate synthase
VVAVADFAGSTAALADYVEQKKPARVVLLTECSMSDNVAATAPATDFIRPCNLCPHMKTITLAGIRDALLYGREKIEVEESVRVRAKQAIDRMLALPLDKRATDFRTGLAPAQVTVFDAHAHIGA